MGSPDDEASGGVHVEGAVVGVEDRRGVGEFSHLGRIPRDEEEIPESRRRHPRSTSGPGLAPDRESIQRGAANGGPAKSSGA